MPPSFFWPDLFKSLIARRELSSQEIHGALTEIMTGNAGEAQTAAFLMGLRMKGETASEIAAAAAVLRQKMVRWDPGQPGVLDTCGTGGDASGTFNISTATAFVVAGAGVPVVKHGNRAVSSRSGSADVLSVLGVALEADPAHARRALDRAGLAFCFAPHFHPALAHVGPVRQKLGVPTIFNCLGPLANPAGAPHQLLGVGRADLVDLIAGALAQLGTTRSFVVHSHDGLDEISLAGLTTVRDVSPAGIRLLEWSPSDFGLAPVKVEDLRVSDAVASAALIEEILAGKESPARRVVIANAAAALMAAGRVGDLKEGVDKSGESIDGGGALRVLKALRAEKHPVAS